MWALTLATIAIFLVITVLSLHASHVWPVVGPRGATGPAGADGATGSAGTDGATGPAGAGNPFQYVLIDSTQAESLLIRKAGDTGDVLAVNSSNSTVRLDGRIGIGKAPAVGLIDMAHPTGNVYMNCTNAGGDTCFMIESIATEHYVQVGSDGVVPNTLRIPARFSGATSTHGRIYFGQYINGNNPDGAIIYSPQFSADLSILQFRVGNSNVVNMSGAGGMFITNSAGAPENISGGGTLYVQGGALKFKGSGGTISTIAPA